MKAMLCFLFSVMDITFAMGCLEGKFVCAVSALNGMGVCGVSGCTGY